MKKQTCKNTQKPPSNGSVTVSVLKFDQKSSLALLDLPSHLNPWRTIPHSISPQWSQKAGAW